MNVNTQSVSMYVYDRIESWVELLKGTTRTYSVPDAIYNSTVTLVFSDMIWLNKFIVHASNTKDSELNHIVHI